MDIDISMVDAIGDHGSGAAYNSSRSFTRTHAPEGENVSSFPEPQPPGPDASANIQTDRMVVLTKGAPTSDNARACQALCRTNSFEHSRHEASQRDYDTRDFAQRSSPPRRRGHYRSRACEQSVYPDYYTPCYSLRDRPPERFNDPRVEQLFEGICAEERNISALVSLMTDMDVGRDDRYRGNGYRGGGNKRRRDGKPCAGCIVSALTDVTL